MNVELKWIHSMLESHIYWKLLYNLVDLKLFLCITTMQEIQNYEYKRYKPTRLEEFNMFDS